MNDKRPVGIGWSLIFGLGYAVVLSAIAAVAMPEHTSLRPGLTFPVVAGLYLAGGLVGGCVFWLLQALRGSRAGRAFIGFACLLPLMTLALFAVPDGTDFRTNVIAAVGAAAFVGGGIGLSVGES